MEIFALINQVPAAWLVFVYLAVELGKTIIRRKTEKERVANQQRNELTDSIFKLYGLAKDDIEAEKAEIRELTAVLKKANIEIAILERKVAALIVKKRKLLKNQKVR